MAAHFILCCSLPIILSQIYLLPLRSVRQGVDYKACLPKTAWPPTLMKTSLTIIPMCPREHFPSYKSFSRLVLFYKKDWDILLHLIYFYYLLPVTNYLITKLFVTYNFSACREYLAENRLSFPSAPRWVRHSYLSKELQLIPYTCGSSRKFSGAVAGE